MLKFQLPIFLFLAFFVSNLKSQCLLYEIPLEQRIANAELIVEGKVISQQAFWNTEHSRIYTSHIIEVYKIFKGETNSSQLSVITQGGIVGNEMHLVNPELKLSINQFGIFFLQSNNEVSTLTSSYAPYANAQGHIQYNLTKNLASDPFKKYMNIEKEVYQTIISQTGNKFKEMMSLPQYSTASQKNAMAVSISSFSPDSVGGGIGDVVTIIGSGFGSSYSGSADVEFKDPDDGGSSYASVPADHIVSWSDTEIKVTVPGSYTSGSNPGAGTGTIRVTNSSGSSDESTNEVVVVYNEMAVEYSGAYYLPKLVDKNSSGGYTWAYNTGFNSNSSAVAAFERALKSWNCGTYVNFAVSGTTSTNCNADDGENIVSFDGSCLLSTGVLGTSFSYYSGCSSGGGWKWHLKGNDILFAVNPSTGYSWNYGPTASSNSQYDLESVALHEMGHSHQLGHIISQGKVMHYSILNGWDIRSLDDTHDIAGGEDIMNRSLVSNSCGPTAMIAYSTANCSSAPVAGFSVDATSGCTPLTLNFTDASTNSPTSWQWDFDNDAIVDATSQNPSYTFSTAGTYSVSLTATNSSGSDSETKSSYITVYETPIAAFQASTTSTTTGTSIQFTDQSSANPTTWLWDFGDGGGSSTQNPSYTYTSSGTYSVTLLVDEGHGCADTLVKSNYISVSGQTGINSIQNKLIIHISPNPFNQFAVLTIANNSITYSKLNIKWHDILGKQANLLIHVENEGIEIHKNGMPAGIYYGQLFYENSLLENIKIVIQ